MKTNSTRSLTERYAISNQFLKRLSLPSLQKREPGIKAGSFFSKILLLIVVLGFGFFEAGARQTTYDFSTDATLSFGDNGFGIWRTQANVTIGGVAYKLTCGGNGSFTNSATGGSGNSKCLAKDGSGGDLFKIERVDGQPFQFYGIWMKHESMNGYSNVPPFFTVTYEKTAGGNEVYTDANPKGGGFSVTYTHTFTKDLAVKSVYINFNAIVNFWIDNIIVGPVAAAPAPAITTHPVNRTICTGNNTSFTVAASNSSSYQWQVDMGSGFGNVSNGGVYSGATSTTLSITGATAGMSSYQYRCVATGTTSPAATSNAATLTLLAKPSVSVSAVDVSCNGGNNGRATASVTGGTAPYSYSWSPSGGTASMATGLSAGSYTVTVTDNNTCQATGSAAIMQPSALTGTASKTDISCNGGNNGTATVSVSGGTAPYSYSWAPSGGTAATATGLATGTYTVTVTDNNNCQITRTVTILQPSVLTGTASKTDVSCNGGNNGTATVSVSGGTAPYSYSWAPSGGTAATASGLAIGTYTVTVTDNNNCQITRTVTITQPASALAGTASKTDVSCNGGTNGTATVSVTGGTAPYSYSWAPSGGTAATASGLATGTYTVTVTDNNACQITRTVTVNQPTALTGTASKTDVSCNGGNNGTATVSVTGGTAPYSYSWAPSGGTAATATGLATGTYTVTVTDNNNCQITRTVTILQPSVLTGIASKTDVSCNGGSNGTATVSVSGGTAPYSYSWAPSGGTAATASGLAAGTYTVTITDNNNCQITRTVTVNQPTVLTGTASKTDVSCNGGTNGTATISVTGGTAPYSYSWAPSGGTAATASGLAAGTYTVTVTDNNNCQITRTVTVNQPTALTATASKTDVSCNGGSNGTATVSVSGGSAPYSYSWAPSGGTAATASGLAAGTYTVTVTDNNNCQITRTVTVNQPIALVVTATPTSQVICDGGQTNIALTSTTSGAGFSWTVTTIGGSVSGTSAGSGSAIQQTLTGNGIVRYTITPSYGSCTGSSVNVLVTVNALTSIGAHPSDKMIDEEENTSFSIEANYATGYQWQVDMGSGFTNISNNAHYSGVTTSTLHITNALEGMNGYQYRCVATGNCDPVPSNSALLTVRVRTPQTISFSATDQKVYGATDYVPSAVSDAGLQITYTSSNNAIASVVDGKISIKQVGQVTITASQPGNNDYKPATSVQQVLTITKRPVAVTLNASPAIHKVYDGNTTITLATGNYTLQNKVTGDDLGISGTAAFTTASAGTGKTVTVSGFVLSGESKDNYDLTTITAATTGEISRKEISIAMQASPLISKTYDASANASPATANYSLTGIVGNDVVNVASGKAAYNDKQAAINKTITVSEFILGGTDKDNYSVTTVSATTTGTIVKKNITLELAAAPAISKIYDGIASASVPAAKYELNGVESEDELSVSGIAVYDNKNAGTGKTVTVNDFILAGADKNNYNLTTEEVLTTGSIEKASLRVQLQSAPVITKVYDGTTSAAVAAGNYTVQGIIGSDEVMLNNPVAGTYDNKHGGQNKKITVNGLAISGSEANNYSLESTSISGFVGEITRKNITIIADGKTKIYGTADPEFTYTAEGRLSGDVLEGALTRVAGKNTGTYVITIGTLSGGDDYLIEVYQSASLTITPATLFIKADNKTKAEGTVNPVFTFTYTGLATGDQPSDLNVQPVATTAATSGSPIGYYDIIVGGASSQNYNMIYTNGRLSVTPSGNKNYSVRAWNSSRDVLQVRIYTTEAQKAGIILYTASGQAVILQQYQLSVGVNSFAIPVGHLASSGYVLAVRAEKFKEGQHIQIKD